ncbi:hypothetical protein [Bacillus sp. B1-b2]|uniref:hypothetical protein n=1 Tax=Bacillus sp. B1-b2 TaxID=2653201 RepID=UPI00186A9AF3|nr:hypothetical protein [Bacillus sp. B1-b2]
MSIFQGFREKIVINNNWKSNLIAQKKFENLYKKNDFQVIYGSIYRMNDTNKFNNSKS